MTEHLGWLTLALCAACGAGTTAPAIDAPAFDDSLYLTVDNVGGHCSVTIDQLEPSAAVEDTVADFAPGQTIPVMASATSGFTLGPWHHTNHDTGSGDPGTLAGSGSDLTSFATITLGDEPGCAWICCGSGSGDCAVADPCL